MIKILLLNIKLMLDLLNTAFCGTLIKIFLYNLILETSEIKYLNIELIVKLI
jgi:hypothetical protein